MLVGLSQMGPDLVVDDQIMLKGLVGKKDVGGHTSSSNEGNDQWANKLVEALVHVDTASSDLGTSELFDFQIKLCGVPPFFGTCSWYPGEHSWICPSGNPLFQVPDPN